MCQRSYLVYQQLEEEVQEEPTIHGVERASILNSTLGIVWKKSCGESCLKTEPAGIKLKSAVAFGVQGLLEFGWQLDTVAKRLQQENSTLTQRLRENNKRNPS